MHKPVLVHAYVHERAERRDIGDDTLKAHPRLEIRDLLDALLETGRPEFRARIATWFLELGEDVCDRRNTELEVSKSSGRKRFEECAVADQRLEGSSRCLRDPLHYRIGLGVNGGGIERVLATHDAQETRCLFKRLGAEPRHLLERGARLEGAVPVAEGHDVVGERLIETRY